MIANKIIVHHSLTKDGLTVSWNAIRNYHINTLGWIDIGYHAGVELVKSGGEGSVEVFLGRPWDKVGSHTIGQNNSSLGVCVVGNYDIEEPTEAHLEAAAKIIRMWMDMYDIGINDIYGHRDFADYKSCPGNLFDMDKLKDRI